MSNTEKTIPYRLSPAEIDNLRILRSKTNSPDAAVDDDCVEESKIRENRDEYSDTIPINKTKHH